VSVSASSSYKLKFSFANTFKSSSGGMPLSSLVLNFGAGGSIFCGGFCPARSAGVEDERDDGLISTLFERMFDETWYGCERMGVIHIKSKRP
jgi:hypothetical protein